MTPKYVISRLRRYGIKGAIDWAINLFRQEQDTVLATLQEYVNHGIKPVRGITIIGNLSSGTSLGKVLCDLDQSLDQSDIPHQTYDTSKPIPNDFCMNRYTDIIGMFRDFNVQCLSLCRQHRIIFWEFDTGFAESNPQAVTGNPLLVFSDYCQRSLRKQIDPTTIINRLIYPFHFEAPNLLPSDKIRAKFNIPNNAFVVFFNFDYRSSYYRKNPEGLLSAFISAFKDIPNAILLYKTIGSKQNAKLRDKLEQLAKSSAVRDQIRFINEYITAEDLVSLTNACDVYASLHRGEGFGLGIAEAMSLGKAVVVSDCGASSEFCHADTAELVPCTILRVKPEQIDHPSYKWVKEWPDPNIDIAATALRKLYEDSQYRIALGQRARAFIKSYYSLENFKRSVDDFLDL